MTVTPAGMLIEVSVLTAPKAAAPIEVSEFGREIEVMPLSANASRRMAVTPSGPTTGPAQAEWAVTTPPEIVKWPVAQG